MAREILFRGKHNKNWVFGSLIVLKNGDCQIENADPDDYSKWEVAPETVGQYTGLQDKHGVKIFEGDIVLKPTEWNDLIGCVEYNFNLASFNAWPTDRKSGCFLITDEDIEVIGNIHDANS